MNVATRPAILPGATLGVLGGGQLGRMFVHSAQQMGYFTAVLDPDAESPAGRISHHHVHCDYLDVDGLARLAGLCDAITTEFENVPASALEHLAHARPVAPGAAAVAVAQDRLAEKALFERCRIACAPHAAIETSAQLAAIADELLPGILKTARLGYDGKGQRLVADRAELQPAWGELGEVACVLEQRLALEFECSIIVARGADGALVHLPAQRNVHQGGILVMTEVYDGNLPAARLRQAQHAAESIAAAMDYVGVLCVEFFVLENGDLLVNEIAPRPHNSGHYSIDACDVSQFDLQVRALAALPLPLPRLHGPSIMLNLLGDLWFDRLPSEVDEVREGSAAGEAHEAGSASQFDVVPADRATDGARHPPWAAILALPGTHLHLYGKSEARRGRKMGHLTLTGRDISQVRGVADEAATLLGMPSLQHGPVPMPAALRTSS